MNAPIAVVAEPGAGVAHLSKTAAPRWPRAPAFGPQALADPYAFYAAVRAQPGLCWSAELGGWLVSRFDDVRAGLADPRLSAARLDRVLAQAFPDDPAARALVGGLNRRSLFFLDPPRHGAARRCMGAALRDLSRGGLPGRMAAHAERLATAIAASGGGDLVADFAAPLSVALMGEMAGGAEPKRQELRASIDAFLGLFGGGPAAQDRAAVAAAVGCVEALVADLLAAPDRPGDTAFDRARAHAAAGGLDHDLLAGVALDLVAGGYAPLTNLIANTFACLLGAPDALDAVRRTPELAGRAVAETARFEAPNQLTSRIASEPFVFAGAGIERGELVTFLLAAANRDASAYPDPDVFDLFRAGGPSLAFGAGSHRCIGASLGAAIAAAAVSALLAQAGRLMLAGELRWSARTLRVRGLEALPVACDPSAQT